MHDQQIRTTLLVKVIYVINWLMAIPKVVYFFILFYKTEQLLCQNYSGCYAATFSSMQCNTKAYGNPPFYTNPSSGSVTINKFCEGN